MLSLKSWVPLSFARPAETSARAGPASARRAWRTRETGASPPSARRGATRRRPPCSCDPRPRARRHGAPRRQAFLAGAPTDPAELRAGPLDPGRRAEPLELAERRADRVAGGALLTLAPADHAEREQRAGPPEGITDRLVSRDGVLEKRSGLGHVSPRGRHEAAAARHVREHPVAFESSRIRLPRVEDVLGVVRPIEREQRLDVVGHPPAFARLTPAEPGGRRL